MIVVQYFNTPLRCTHNQKKSHRGVPTLKSVSTLLDIFDWEIHQIAELPKHAKVFKARDSFQYIIYQL